MPSSSLVEIEVGFEVGVYFIPERNAKQRVGIVFIKLAPKTQYEHEYIWLVNFMDKLGS